MKKLLVLFIFLPFIGYSQNYKTVNEKGDVVPFVTIYNAEKETGVISDVDGLFEFSVGNTVIISSVGYMKDTIQLQPCSNVCDIVLKQDIRQLNEVTVYSNKKKWNDNFTAGFYNKKRSYYTRYQNNPSGFTFLLKIENPQNKPAKLLQANFDVRNNNATTLRVRVFAINEEGEPGRDLLLDNVMVNSFNLFTDVSVNLEKYNVIMPANGVFIGLDVYKISEEDIKFNLGIVPDANAKSFMGNTFKDDRFYLSDRTVDQGNSYMFRNYRFGVKAAY